MLFNDLGSSIGQPLDRDWAGGSDKGVIKINRFFVDAIFRESPQLRMWMDVESSVQFRVLMSTAVEDVAKGLRRGLLARTRHTSGLDLRTYKLV